MAVNRVI